MGMPRLGVVRVDNRLTDENLKLISISGSTLHFHSSFFADKVRRDSDLWAEGRGQRSKVSIPGF